MACKSLRISVGMMWNEPPSVSTGHHGDKIERRHTAAGHGNGDHEDPFQEAVPHKEGQKPYDGAACREADDGGGQDFDRGAKEQVPVNAEEASADQRRDVKNEKALFIHESVRRLVFKKRI